MRLLASSAILLSFLAGSTFAQAPGQWQNTENGMTLAAKDFKHSISLKSDGNILSFIVNSPDYLKTQPEPIKATVRFDTERPQSFAMTNFQKQMAVVKGEKARSLIEQLALAKKLHVRLYSHDERYCDDLVFDNTFLDLPKNTPEVVAKLLHSSSSAQ